MGKNEEVLDRQGAVFKLTTTVHKSGVNLYCVR